MNFNPFDLLEIFYIIYRATGKIIFSDHFTTEDWMKLLADEDFINLLRRLFDGRMKEEAKVS